MAAMRAISLFSGVEGFGLGFERAGIETVLQAERDPWALEVLARHWPQTERVTDVRSVGERHFSERGASRSLVTERGWSGQPDLVYGGFPCQDLSVAGKRAGLGGERSGLWFEFERVLSELRPRWAVIENVPGLLSSNQGRDFAVILDGLDELGFDVAWAVLDAQHFGVPQRRRRVFVVAGPSRRSVEQVLSLCESCGGNPETGRAAGEDVAGILGGGAGERGWSPDTDRMTFLPTYETDHSGTVMASWGNSQVGNAQLDAAPLVVSFDALNHSTSPIAATLADDKHRKDYVVGALPAKGPGAMGAPEVDAGHYIMGALDTKLGDKMWLENQSVEKYGTMQLAGAGVRRLTPLECERLMGWPDDHTRWTADGREIADRHRYRMCGNGVVAPVAEWIGHRLVAVDSAHTPTSQGEEHDAITD